MRRVVVSSQQIEVVEAEAPTPGPGEVLVRSVVAGVCGSDTHAAHGRHPFIALPYHPGHEVVGVVEQLGEGVDAVRPGQRVTVEPDLPCWACKQCTAGRQNLCENLQFFGCGYAQGGMADYFTIDVRRLHVVPDGMDFRTAALIEPLSTPVHAVRLAGNVSGSAVAILGAGTIGLLVLCAAKAQGARRIVVTDVLPAKRERALALGADVVVDAAAPNAVQQVREALGESADVVFDCVAVQPTVDQAVAMADKGGTVVIVGVPAGAVSVPLPIIQDHQIRIQGSATYLPEDYADAIRLLASGAIPVEAIVTAVHPLAEVAEAFDASVSGANIKVLVAIDDELAHS
ncbi:MAG: alcohol dehydrogenase catalytic domain-containing protein [Kineosporiaceae bacterium]|nr:alcohol dehydrogenase catalytic domain-containing protein [Kineosporiaceae bacterium]MBK7624886.1 alcohol dehydrogenase catalytic domain-containing protein [Kineosporiaceae bacterium]MBK8076735.1 alcohol dehydrogenase catalytic domain-containing protein [Kineosporiaceae bacterium]